MGRQIEYGDADFARVANLLSAHGQQLAPDSGPLDRGDAAIRPGITEKSGTQAPHSNSVAFRVLGQPAHANGVALNESTIAYAVASTEDIAGIVCDAVLVVENFETFRQLHRYKWLTHAALPSNVSTVALFRGDRIYKIEDSQRAVAAMKAPTWGFFDFDPAGLHMCSSLPRLERLLLPNLEQLEKAARLSKRTDLYYTQLEVFEASLNACSHPEIQCAWELIKRVRCGLPQEWMRDIQLGLDQGRRT